MKKLTFNLLAIGFSLAVFTSSYANERYLFVDVDVKSESERVVFDLSYFDGSEASCYIYDEEGILVYVDDFEINGMARKAYNLESLNSGKYTFVLNDERQTIEYDVVKNKSQITIQNQPEITFKPSVFMDDEKNVDFHLLSLGKNVTLELFNATGSEIFTQEVIGLNTISKRFNMKYSPKGEYTLKVQVGDDVYYEYITI